jgi:C4-dicarboxylate-specific signal transduction histidine kinase
MTVELIVLVASVLMIFAFGVLIGHRHSKRQFAARVRRQDAAQLSLYRQLHELQVTRQRNYPTRMNGRILHKVQQ